MAQVVFRNLSGRPVDEEPLTAVVQRVLASEGRALGLLSVALVDEARMVGLNWRLLRHEGPTDVIAFEAEEGEGEIILSVDAAQSQAAEAGHSPHYELCFLLAHGLLHVLGHDDGTPAERAAMLRRQDEILQES